MNILIVSPLYPPDNAPSALYVKELAKRLSFENNVSIVTYGRIPEKIPNVSIHVTDKYKPLIFRLFDLTKLLLKEGKGADIIYMLNGPSVELPATVSSLLLRKKIILHIGDEAADLYAEHNKVYKFIKSIASNRVINKTSTKPLKKPEILPFKEVGMDELNEYEESWITHMHELNELFEKYGL